MGSKRPSSKAPNEQSTTPPAAPPADENLQNLKSRNPESPSKPRKKPKLSNPKSTDSAILPPVLPTKEMKHKIPTSKLADSGFRSPIPSTDVEAPSRSNNLKGKTPDISNELSPSDGRANRSPSFHWGKAYNLKFLEAFVAFRLKHGYFPTASKLADLLTEINGWAPYTLSEKNLFNKIRHFRFLFQRNPEPGPESSEYERTFHQLGSQLWGPGSLKAKGSATGAQRKGPLKEKVKAQRKGDRKGLKEKMVPKKLNWEKKNVDDDKEYEDDEEKEDRLKDKMAPTKLNEEKKNVDDDKEYEDDEEKEERDDENDEGGDEKAGETREVESGKEHEKVDLGEDNGLLDGDVTKFPYKYLKLALEEYWTEAKLNMNTLYSALPKVDPVQAKLLDEQYSELFKGMLKLKMEKNEIFNKIIRSSLGH